MKINNFDVLKEMGNRNLDIRLSNNFLRSQANPKGGTVTMAVDRQTIIDMATGKSFIICLLFADTEQFSAVKAEMESQQQ
jgi:hypothetical protein